MELSIVEIPPQQLSRYVEIPIAFEVRSMFKLVPLEGENVITGSGLGGLALVEEPVVPSIWKDYDRIGGVDTGPLTWSSEFDLSHWKIFLAMEGAQAVGGAALVMDTPGVHMLEHRPDLAVLWDIRVAFKERGQGVGKALFQHAMKLAQESGRRQMKVETQNVNVNACRFYARMGCHLGSIQRYGYAGDPYCADEVMLLWYLDLL